MAAASPLNFKAIRHCRSRSYPIDEYPFSTCFQEALSRLRSSQFTSTSSSPIHHKLDAINNLHVCLHSLLPLPLTTHSQKNTLQDHHYMKLIEAALDSSLRLLDGCCSAVEALSQAKESATRIQSMLRTRCGDKEIAEEVHKYLSSRRQIKKRIAKFLKDSGTKRVEKDDNDRADVVALALRECELVTLEAISSLLLHIAAEKDVQKTNKWCDLVPKLVRSRHVVEGVPKEAAVLLHQNEFEVVDRALHSLIISKRTNKFITSRVDSMELRQHVEQLEFSVLGLQDRIDCLSRHLISFRVSLLNVLDH